MKKALVSLIPSLVASFIVAFPFSAAAQNREKFVISAHAGGVNAVTGRAAMRTRGNGDWQQLTSKEDLEKGDVVRTGLDGRVEMLLNPGSYLRIGENSEVELTDNSLENLEVRLLRGTAIVEVTGADDTELLINITTPHTRMAIVRRGLYRVNVVPGDATELIVRKGRVMLDRTHTKVKGGNKVIFSENSFSVAKLKKEDKTRDNLEAWSKDRAQTLARANSSLSRRDINLLLASARFDYWFDSFAGRSGCWLYLRSCGCYTFFPFSYGWGSPYGSVYSASFFAGGYCCGRGIPGLTRTGGSGTGNGTGYGVGSGTGSGTGGGPSNPPPPTYVPPSPMSEGSRRDVSTPGPGSAHGPDRP